LTTIESYLKQVKDEMEHKRIDTWQPLESLTPFQGLSDSVMRQTAESVLHEIHPGRSQNFKEGV